MNRHKTRERKRQKVTNNECIYYASSQNKQKIKQNVTRQKIIQNTPDLVLTGKYPGNLQRLIRRSIKRMQEWF